MSETSEHPDVRLERLRREERSLSAQRTRLQDRIDFVRAGGAGTGSEDQLATLERQERELSERRRALHREIDTLAKLAG